jgi:murein DD-endopeptidase MepM/ murein hydrolase activator NlpD
MGSNLSRRRASPHPWPMHALALPIALMVVGLGSMSPSDAPLATAGWPWPVRGPVIRGFDPPEDPFGAGHRGIDIAAPIGTVVVAPAPGTVAFAGKVGGHLFVTLDHGGELTTTYSWLSATSVRKGDSVTEGQAFAATGTGHPGAAVPHLHFGVRLAGLYLDPLTFLLELGVVDLIRLAPFAA